MTRVVILFLVMQTLVTKQAECGERHDAGRVAENDLVVQSKRQKSHVVGQDEHEKWHRNDLSITLISTRRRACHMGRFQRASVPGLQSRYENIVIDRLRNLLVFIERCLPRGAFRDKVIAKFRRHVTIQSA